MQLGLSLPILSADHDSPRWERSSGTTELVQIAQAADRLGFHHLATGEHIAVPPNLRRWDGKLRGTTYWDPLPTLAYLAAGTERIRLATLVLVIGYHHPLALAKSYGTLDLLSGGRLILGLGVGTLEQEFELLEVSFKDRGGRADDSLGALRAALGTPRPRYEGRYVSFRDAVVSPNGSGRPIPIWIGGHTKRSLRRALTYADGWAPNGLSIEAISAMLGDTKRPDGFDLVVPTPALDPRGDPDGTWQVLDRLQNANVTVANARVTHDSFREYLAQLEALRELWPSGEGRDSPSGTTTSSHGT